MELMKAVRCNVCNDGPSYGRALFFVYILQNGRSILEADESLILGTAKFNRLNETTLRITFLC
jgi:hypothetical protein